MDDHCTARLAESGENSVNEAMATKLFATETVGEIVDSAIQLVGGGALVEDHPLAALYRQVRAWRLAEASSMRILGKPVSMALAIPPRSSISMICSQALWAISWVSLST